MQVVDELASFGPREDAGLALELPVEPFEIVGEQPSGLVELVAVGEQRLLTGDVDRIDGGGEFLPRGRDVDELRADRWFGAAAS